MSGKLEIAIVAPSSVVPPVELEAGVNRLRRAGFGVTIHPQCAARHFTFAGSDAERATAFYEVATDPKFDVVWCARGGYGSTRLLPLLQKMQEEHGVPPRKLVIGYSDATALHAFVSRYWNWATLHAAMPASEDFGRNPLEWNALVDLLRGRRPDFLWERKPLTFLTPPPPAPIIGELIGGTLTLYAATCGTSYFPETHGRILFLEDVGEQWYRIDRMVTQLSQAGAFENVRAIVLGNFNGCRDDVPSGLQDATPGSPRIPLRDVIGENAALDEIFGAMGRRFGIPVAKGLPVGHGPDCWPLPLFTPYRLHSSGRFELIEWERSKCATP